MTFLRSTHLCSEAARTFGFKTLTTKGVDYVFFSERCQEASQVFKFELKMTNSLESPIAKRWSKHHIAIYCLYVCFTERSISLCMSHHTIAFLKPEELFLKLERLWR